MVKRKKDSGKECEEAASKPATDVPPLTRDSDEPPKKKSKWTNRQRVLVFCSRGVLARERHLMEDVRTILPHSKAEQKKDGKDDLRSINEIVEIKNCTKCIYFENRKKKDFYMWVANVPRGPSIKFHILNIHTLKELKLSGNSLRGSRPILSFDESFNEPHWAVIRELFAQVFGTPNQHPRSQPFIDRVFTFTVIKNKIWFRNFAILEEDGQLAEIGPRFVLNPVKILSGSFCGTSLWANPKFKTPSSKRHFQKMLESNKFHDKASQKKAHERRIPMKQWRGDPTDEVFNMNLNELPLLLQDNEAKPQTTTPKPAYKPRRRKPRVHRS